MKKFKYLLYHNLKKVKAQRKRCFVCVIVFYIGFLLPAFCLANTRNFDQLIYYTTFENMENAVEISWFSDDFNAIKKIDGIKNSFSCVVEENFKEWNNTYISVYGIDEIAIYPRFKINGKEFTKYDYKNGTMVCKIPECYAKKYSYHIGDKIKINNHILKIKGIIYGSNMADSVYVPFNTMKKIYREKDRLQFTGVFISNNQQMSKTNIANNIQEQILENKDSTELLYIEDGGEMYEDAIKARTQWRMVRVLVACVSLVLFIINISIVLLEKFNYEKNFTGINLAFGATHHDINVCNFIESLSFSIISAVFVFLSLEPIARIFSLDSIILVDVWVGIVFSLIVIITNIVLTSIIAYKLKKNCISELLKSRGK